MNDARSVIRSMGRRPHRNAPHMCQVIIMNILIVLLVLLLLFGGNWILPGRSCRWRRRGWFNSRDLPHHLFHGRISHQNVKVKKAAKDFPVVCIGGSAGGLDAYTRLLRHLPSDMGVAIVIVNHLRTVATQLHEILPSFTGMPVKLITERLDIQPNQVFIIPAQRDLHVLAGEFRLKPISKPRGWPDVITVFLRSLTKHWNGKIIAVIVSGYDGDGAAATVRHQRSGRHYH